MLILIPIAVAPLVMAILLVANTYYILHITDLNMRLRRGRFLYVKRDRVKFIWFVTVFWNFIYIFRLGVFQLRVGYLRGCLVFEWSPRSSFGRASFLARRSFPQSESAPDIRQEFVNYTFIIRDYRRGIPRVWFRWKKQKIFGYLTDRVIKRFFPHNPINILSC